MLPTNPPYAKGCSSNPTVRGVNQDPPECAKPEHVTAPPCPQPNGEIQKSAQSAITCADPHKPGWRNAKHAAQWSATLERHAYPVIGTKPVAAVLTEHVLRLLQPIWTELPETARRVRGEAILDYSAAPSG
jgi:hypothetical protein